MTERTLKTIEERLAIALGDIDGGCTHCISWTTARVLKHVPELDRDLLIESIVQYHFKKYRGNLFTDIEEAIRELEDQESPILT